MNRSLGTLAYLRTLVAAVLLFAGTLVGGPAAPEPPNTPDRPDLVVRVDLQKEQRFGHWKVRMRFTVSNIGLAQAPKTSLGTWCVTGPRACPHVHVPAHQFSPAIEAGATSVVRLDTPEIPANDSVVVLGPETEEWQPGRFTIRAKADFMGHLVEANEANNVGFAVIVIP